ncbi:hypothetical protein, partial [Pseudomonas reidholzensis]|uniref:hypothetical protein n=1 Tax=Pseudomonas reidholzensis TaxID=1785162 RepID=UPI001ABF0062
MWEPAVFGYFFPRKKVTRRKGGRGHKRHHLKWISTPSPRAHFRARFLPPTQIHFFALFEKKFNGGIDLASVPA